MGTEMDQGRIPHTAVFSFAFILQWLAVSAEVDWKWGGGRAFGQIEESKRNLGRESEEDRRYVSDLASFSFELPQGWERIPGHVVASRRVELRDRYSIDLIPPCEAAFQRIDQEHWFTYPYFFVQTLERRRMSRRSVEAFMSELEDQIEKGILGEQGPSNPFETVISPPTLDEKAWSARCELEATLAGETVRVLYRFFFYRTGIVGFYFYGSRSEFEQQVVDFESLIRSVAFEPGHTYDGSAAISERLPAFLMTQWGTVVIVFFLVLLIFLVRRVIEHGERRRQAMQADFEEVEDRIARFRRERRERMR